MKKYLVLVISYVVAGSVYAQQPADYLMKARALNESGRNREAVTILTEGLARYRDYRFLVARAEANMVAGDYTSASADFQSANSLASASGEYGLAKISAIKGDATGALKHLENSINSPYKKSEKEIMLDAAFSVTENSPEWRLFWKKERYSTLERKISEIEYYVTAGKSDDAVTVLG